MICRFCSQWNAEGSMRCCFCNNPMDATEDKTLSGTPDYIRNTGQQVQVPKAIRSSFDQRPHGQSFDALEALRSGDGVDRVKAIGTIVAIVVAVLVALWLKC